MGFSFISSPPQKRVKTRCLFRLVLEVFEEPGKGLLIALALLPLGEVANRSARTQSHGPITSVEENALVDADGQEDHTLLLDFPLKDAVHVISDPQVFDGLLREDQELFLLSKDGVLGLLTEPAR